MVSSLLKYYLLYTIRPNGVRDTFLDLPFLLLTNVLDQINIRDGRIRANLAGALVRFNPEKHNSADEQSRGVDSGQQVLRQLFGLGE